MDAAETRNALRSCLPGRPDEDLMQIDMHRDVPPLDVAGRLFSTIYVCASSIDCSALAMVASGY